MDFNFTVQPLITLNRKNLNHVIFYYSSTYIHYPTRQQSINTVEIKKRFR